MAVPKGYKWSEQAIKARSEGMKRAHQHKQWGFQKGHHPWNTGISGIHLSPETEFKKGGKAPHPFPKGHHPWNKGTKGVCTPWNRGLSGGKLTTEHKQRISQALKGNPKLSNRLLALWADPNWANARVEAIIRGCQRKPNASEQKLAKLISDNSLPFRYVGDGQIIIGGKCPDFINTNGKKQVIELFGEHWHNVLDVGAKTEQYRQYGFSVLIIWESEMKRNPDKVIEKVRTFARRRK